MLLKDRKALLVIILALLTLAFIFYFFVAKNGQTTINGSPTTKISLGADHYFTYQFNQRPVLGTNILKVQVYDNDGKKAVPFRITGSYGMPAMGNAHDSAEQDFQINKHNDYLLPVDLVMPGDWEISLVFYKGKAEYGHSKIKVTL